MLCSVCNQNYEGHFNSRVCSVECRKVLKSRVNDKYNSSKRNERFNDESTNLQGEIWKDITGYEGIYKISNLGRVKSSHRTSEGGILKPNLSPQGYYRIGLRKRGLGVKHFFIHRLIALHFIDNPNNLPHVDHINRNREDYRLENLRWISPKDNNLNTKSYDRSGSIRRTKYTKKNNEVSFSYRVSFRNKKFRNKSKVKCICWLFENNEHLMKTITKANE